MLPSPEYLNNLLAESAGRHQHLCPRQVLGVRMGIYGLRLLGLTDDTQDSRFNNADKRLLTIVETDGCGADGIAVATDCSIGHRTLRVLDMGKLAATLVDTRDERAIRVTPAAKSRQLARSFAPNAESLWHAYRDSYKIIPDEELMIVQAVQLVQTLEEILSKPEARVCCSMCGEEIINERERWLDGHAVCLSCAGERYYRTVRNSLR